MGEDQRLSDLLNPIWEGQGRLPRGSDIGLRAKGCIKVSKASRAWNDPGRENSMCKVPEVTLNQWGAERSQSKERLG